ncbi:unnamed protein product [Gongylonema pulchrum]|uniref:Uncharacterized protein n=1 Tax=Gongylonema pulchrum TaxID=637853 RepID=A0A183EJZ7_9BILA|nr:unnamed protein product [Gongylonema pulchrum]
MRGAMLGIPPQLQMPPSHAMPPPFRLMPQCPTSRVERPPLPPMHFVPYQQQQLQQPYRPNFEMPTAPMRPPSHGASRCSNRDRTSRRSGLPSSKTISDFALSPFAGFVSKKEREWLIKIQLLQCQGCGNPYEDDFYFTVWRQKQIALERRKKGLKPATGEEGDECDYAISTANAHHYVPPTFVGTLGKPTLSTVNYPRHLIDLSNDTTDDDKLSMKSSASQKKLRALLLQLENIALLIVECDDRKRFLNELRDGIQSRLKAVIDSLCSSDRLQTVLLINKGRQMFTRALALADEDQRVLLLKYFFTALTNAWKRLPTNEVCVLFVSNMIFSDFRRFDSQKQGRIQGDLLERKK